MNNPKIKIMIVEDEALIALDMKLQLKQLGYDVFQKPPVMEKPLLRLKR